MNRLALMEWRVRPLRPGLFSCAMLAGCVVVIGLLTYWRSGLASQLQRSEQRLEQAMSRRPQMQTQHPAASAKRSAAEIRQLQMQIALLNRDWVRLLQELVPAKGNVRLLEVDVNSATAAIRITGRAGDSNEANAYAEALQARGDLLRDVRLLLLERKNGGTHFEVSAQWAE